MSILTKNTLDSALFSQESFLSTQHLTLSSSESFTSAPSLNEFPLASFVPMAVAAAADLGFDPSLAFIVEGCGRRRSLDFGPSSSQAQSGAAAETVFVEEMLDFFIDPLEPQGFYVASTVRPCPPEQQFAVGTVGSSSSASSAIPSASPPTSYSSGHVDKAQAKRERNRLAAERCRARKLNMISSLQEQCSRLRQERDQLMLENQRLRGILLGAPGPDGQRLGAAASLGGLVGRP